MTCVRFRDLLPLFAGRELEPSAAAEIRRHLALCTRCRDQTEAFGSQALLLRDYGRRATPVPPDLWSGLQGRLKPVLPGPGPML